MNLLRVALPSSVPYLLSVMKVNIGLCLVGVVIGEFIGAKQGLGFLIIYSSQIFKLDWMILSIILTVYHRHASLSGSQSGGKTGGTRCRSKSFLIYASIEQSSYLHETLALP